MKISHFFPQKYKCIHMLDFCVAPVLYLTTLKHTFTGRLLGLQSLL